jgi:uncharacterized glyoxalase superfamily protein PhnB
MAVQPIPPGHYTVTPYIAVENAKGLIEFLRKAFNAVETHPATTRPDGTVMHAEMRIGNSPVMLAEACGEWKPRTACLYLYVEDVDAVYKQAIAAGGTSIMPPTDMFYGDRSGGVNDTFGNMWWMATHIEDVAPDELERRAAAMMAKQEKK